MAECRHQTFYHPPTDDQVECSSVCPPLNAPNDFCTNNCNEYELCMRSVTNQPIVTEQAQSRMTDFHEGCVPDQSFYHPTLDGYIRCEDVCRTPLPTKQLDFCRNNCNGFMNCLNQSATESGSPVLDITPPLYMVNVTPGVVLGVVAVILLLVTIACLLGFAIGRISRKAGCCKKKKVQFGNDEESLELNASTGSTATSASVIMLSIEEETTQPFTRTQPITATQPFTETINYLQLPESDRNVSAGNPTAHSTNVNNVSNEFSSSTMEYENSLDLRSCYETDESVETGAIDWNTRIYS